MSLKVLLILAAAALLIVLLLRGRDGARRIGGEADPTQPPKRRRERRKEARKRKAPAPADGLEDLILAGRKIEAIKMVRETEGIGLKEAKDLVEKIEADLRKKRGWE